METLMKIPSKVLLAALAVTLLAVPASADFDYTGLYNQVQSNEARITNAESDIKTLQDNTNTAPAPNPTNVPLGPAPVAPTAAAVSSAPIETPVITPVPKATTKTIVAVSNDANPGAFILTGPNQTLVQCKYTYDDGSVSYEHSVDPDFKCKEVGTVVPL